MSELKPVIQEQAERILEYRFRDPQVLVKALTHASVAEDRLHSNERMEFLGDALLGAIVCEYLFHHYPEFLEGELTKVKSAVVSRRVCADVATALGLPELLSLGKGMTSRGEQLPASLAAAVYESIVAAIYLDGGMEETRRFILKHLEPLIHEAAESTHQQNFKSLLQQYAQKKLEQVPTYRLLDERGPDHSKTFQVCAELNGRRFASAWGTNKKQAEQDAALLALQELGVARVEDDGSIEILEDF
ncbi:MAG: ribonuclease III [Phycisphaeraceae bacterium]